MRLTIEIISIIVNSLTFVIFISFQDIESIPSTGIRLTLVTNKF